MATRRPHPEADPVYILVKECGSGMPHLVSPELRADGLSLGSSLPSL